MKQLNRIRPLRGLSGGIYVLFVKREQTDQEAVAEVVVQR